MASFVASTECAVDWLNPQRSPIDQLHGARCSNSLDFDE
ncbi:hypothetical protein ACUXAV_002279 [Cupriavidus metallidurans]|jgi:hypothetical protein|nr:hypothetical protein AU374_03458 [Cupriavidus metallidurans]